MGGTGASAAGCAPAQHTPVMGMAIAVAIHMQPAQHTAEVSQHMTW